MHFMCSSCLLPSLGPFSHTLYTPTPLTLSSNSIVSVALGQDHTLALTSAGEVTSWGLNRFAQLGYVVESGQGGSADESIQTTPRKIGHLKKESIKGVAACKTASACWSGSDVWTWGTNGGQLGKFALVLADHANFYMSCGSCVPQDIVSQRVPCKYSLAKHQS